MVMNCYLLCFFLVISVVAINVVRGIARTMPILEDKALMVSIAKKAVEYR